MALLVLLIDLTRVVAISTFAMLFYYAIANISALRLKTQERSYSKVVPVLGVFTCLALLALTVLVSPDAGIIGALGLIAGAIYYFVRKRLS
jgi:APA family basic amino acid/polyamine antiporter